MYLPHLSGVTNHVRLYKRRFEDLGHEVYLFTFGDRDYEDAEPNVIRTAGLPWGDTGWRFAPAFSAQARSIIPTLDIAHAHHPFLSGPLALPYCRRHDIPLVLTNHTRYDLYSDEYARFVPRPLRYAYLKVFLGTFANACDMVIAPAPSIAEWLEEFCEYGRATVIPNGIDLARFAEVANPVDRAELGFGLDDIVLCYAGRLGPEKNTEWLMTEFARAAAEEPRLRLLVVGDGHSRDDAEAVLAQAGMAERARFVGLQPYERIPEFEAAADGFVTASVSEVHPLVVIEAMAAGLPVIAVHSPGISDTVEDGVSGLLAPEVRDGVLAERMLALAGDEALRQRLHDGALEAAQSYAFEYTADVVLEHYERLIANRSGA